MEERRRTLTQDVQLTGYDREAEYFYQLNRELIERNRRELDRLRQVRAETKLMQEHWMKCPKCGHDLREEEVLGLKGDLCGTCGGVYFDRDEIMQLTTTHEPHVFKEAIRHIFAMALKGKPTGIGQFPV
jgi:hypothetical protein